MRVAGRRWLMSAAARILGVWSAFDAREAVTYLSGCNVPASRASKTYHASLTLRQSLSARPVTVARALSCYSRHTPGAMAAVGRAFTAHAGTPAIPRGRRVVGVAASLGSGVPPSRRRRDRPVRVFLVGRSR